ncbi:MAG: hypothetical protein ACLTJN_05540 [Monoglobus pectinilyticus]
MQNNIITKCLNCKKLFSAQEKVRNAYGVSANDPVAGWLLDAERRVSEFSSGWINQKQRCSSIKKVYKALQM